jgi:hypothetical protein
MILLHPTEIFIHACAPAMHVEIQPALTVMEANNPAVLGPEDVVVQEFGLQSMFLFAGVFFGPLCGGFVDDRWGWGAMIVTSECWWH